MSLPFVLAGCAGEAPPLASLTSSPTATIGTAHAVAVPGVSAAAADVQRPAHKTMSDRVLTAIALERVTGLKPDPARFVP
jgi:hypothetical protein